MNHKKRLVDAEASPLIHASIHRSLVPPTALQYTDRLVLPQTLDDSKLIYLLHAAPPPSPFLLLDRGWAQWPKAQSFLSGGWRKEKTGDKSFLKITTALWKERCYILGRNSWFYNGCIMKRCIYNSSECVIWSFLRNRRMCFVQRYTTHNNVMLRFVTQALQDPLLCTVAAPTKDTVSLVFTEVEILYASKPSIKAKIINFLPTFIDSCNLMFRIRDILVRTLYNLLVLNEL